MSNKLSPLILVFISICIIVGSCAKEEGSDPLEVERPAFEDTLVFTASAQTLGLFENITFDIKTNQKDNEKGGLAYYIGTRLDSVIWELPGIFNETYVGNRMPISLEQSFYLPGKYQAKVTGYRDSLAVSKDSAVVEIKLDGDFIGINWDIEDEEITSRSFKFVSLAKGFTLELFHSLTESPYMLLSYKINDYSGRDKYKEEIDATRPFFYNYITTLYGESASNYDGTDVTKTPLGNEYAERFKNTLTGSATDSIPYYPLALWDTPACHIALIGSAPSASGEISISYYKIIAEPIKIHF